MAETKEQYNERKRRERAAQRARDPENVRKNGKKAKHKRRECEFPYARLDPWPSDCQCCHLPIDGAVKHSAIVKDPMGETDGHKPPIHWADTHPEFTGPYVIRPEHWKCNHKKGARPDWEL